MGVPAKTEPKIDLTQFTIATAGALLIGVLYYAIPNKLRIGPPWLLFVVEVVLVTPLVISVLFFEHRMPYKVKRSLAVTLLAVVTLALVGSLVLLVTDLPTLASRGTQGGDLLRSATLLWTINVLVFATWYWETDGGGPHTRRRKGHKAEDFCFPQQQQQYSNPMGWIPGFIDYLYLAFCFATALSPADTVPLTRRAKLLAMFESIISMMILVLLVARSVNII